MDTIGQRVLRERERLGLSQQQLATRVGQGVKQQSIDQVEKGHIQKPRFLIYLADALGVSARWLLEGGTKRLPEGKPLPPVPIVGYVGAGAEIHPIDDHAKGVGHDDAPPFPGQEGPAVAVWVRGDSMLPQIEDGWILYYTRDGDVVPPGCVGKLCVVQVTDGPMLVKKLEPGRRKGLWRLVSYNASPRDDVKLDWAARVLAIVP